MKHPEQWQPTKYVRHRGALRGSRDRRELSVASRLITDRVARCFDAGLRTHARGRLLDLGCGKVPFFAAYRSYVDDNVCVDWGNSLHRNVHLDVETDLTQRLPFDDATFDTIVLSDVLEHIAEPERLWSEMARLLAPGGRVMVSVPFFYWLHETPHDYHRYTEFALKRLVERSGLRVVLLEPYGGAPEIVTDIFAKNALRIPAVGPWVAVVAQWLTDTFTRTGLGRRLSEGTASSFPLGYFLVAAKLSAAT